MGVGVCVSKKTRQLVAKEASASYSTSNFKPHPTRSSVVRRWMGDVVGRCLGACLHECPRLLSRRDEVNTPSPAGSLPIHTSALAVAAVRAWRCTETQQYWLCCAARQEILQTHHLHITYTPSDVVLSKPHSRAQNPAQPSPAQPRPQHQVVVVIPSRNRATKHFPSTR
ncbi:hypothetical protein BKA80DRAFT_32753 [Phyllosticta citrichinensis]